MNNKPFGFVVPGSESWRQQSADNPEVILTDVDAEFIAMLDKLQLDNTYLQAQLHVEKDIQEQLAKLHVQTQALIKEAHEYFETFSHYKTLRQVDPVRADVMFSKAKEAHLKLKPKVLALQNQIHKHVLPEIDELYKDRELTKQATYAIREIALTMLNNLQDANHAILSTSERWWDEEGTHLELLKQAKRLENDQ